MSLDENLTLFYADKYGEATKRRATRQGGPALPVEPLEDPWVYMRNQRGPIPYAHIIKHPVDNLGSYVAICNQVGRKLNNHGVTEMIRCPECEVGRQLS